MILNKYHIKYLDFFFNKCLFEDKAPHAMACFMSIKIKLGFKMFNI